MNIAEVEALGATLRESADRLAKFSSVLDRLVGRTPWWGIEATRFKNQWWPQHRNRLGQLTIDLRGFAQSAMNNASEQQRASGVGGVDMAPTGVASDVRVDFLAAQGMSAGSPSDVRKWWDSLTTRQQDALRSERPGLLGNLDGVPPDVRYQANRSNIEAYVNLLRARQAAAGEITKFAALLGDGRQILLFDPSRDGRIAEVFGNLTTADDIAVVVPGIGTSLSNYRPDYALNIYRERRGDTATIMWVGYDTPSAPQDVNPADPSMVSAARAKEWAPTLAAFTGGLRSNGYGEISIVAHSYGTVLATEAAKAGMIVERVILLGSPGVPADDASVFHGADVFASKNPLDYVPIADVHGTDPTSGGFGAHLLPGNNIKLLDHSSYFNRGSDALGGIVGAIEGSRAGPDGMVGQRYVHDDGSAEDIWTGTF